MREEKKNYYLRDIMGNYMVHLGEKKANIVLVNSDLMGTCRNKRFVERFPERVFNVGIAEQNQVSFSAGLAHEGFKVYAFSMAQFLSMRACEQVRTDVAYGNLDIKLIGTYAGVSGGISGATHWAIEDIGIITAMPNMIVLEPCDPIQAKRILDFTLIDRRPTYIRSTLEPVPAIYSEDYEFEIGKASIARDGNDGSYICSGITVKFALEAAEMIYNETGKHIRVVDMHTIKPLDRNAIIDAAKTGIIVVAHDHNIIGGLGNLVAMILSEESLHVRFINLGVKDEFSPMAHAAYLYHKYGYDTEGLYKVMKRLLEE